MPLLYLRFPPCLISREKLLLSVVYKVVVVVTYHKCRISGLSLDQNLHFDNSPGTLYGPEVDKLWFPGQVWPTPFFLGL